MVLESDQLTQRSRLRYEEDLPARETGGADARAQRAHLTRRACSDSAAALPRRPATVRDASTARGVRHPDHVASELTGEPVRPLDHKRTRFSMPPARIR
jgi:hypothetical protein